MIVPHLPDRFVGGIDRYLRHGIIPGDFLAQVLKNDLKESMAKADETSVLQLPGLVGWLYSYAPQPCWGSVEAIRDWVKHVKSIRADGPGQEQATADHERLIDHVFAKGIRHVG